MLVKLSRVGRQWGGNTAKTCSGCAIHEWTKSKKYKDNTMVKVCITIVSPEAISKLRIGSTSPTRGSKACRLWKLLVELWVTTTTQADGQFSTVKEPWKL